jgi:hypothetical protein
MTTGAGWQIYEQIFIYSVPGPVSPGSSTVKGAPGVATGMLPLTEFPGALSGTVALALGLLVTAAWLYYLYR